MSPTNAMDGAFVCSALIVAMCRPSITYRLSNDTLPASPSQCGALSAAAFARVAFGAPTQHAAGEVGDIGEAFLLQDDGRLRRAAAGAAYRHDRLVARQFGRALRQPAERDQLRAAD